MSHIITTPIINILKRICRVNAKFFPRVRVCQPNNKTNILIQRKIDPIVYAELVKPTPIRMLVFVAAELADPPPGTGFMFTLQSLAKMMMMGVMIMRNDVCGLFSTNIPMIPHYSI